MLKSDLKDGYLITLDCGDKYYICGGYGMHPSQPDSLPLFKYNEDLTYRGTVKSDSCMDVIGISYLNTTLWCRGND